MSLGGSTVPNPLYTSLKGMQDDKGACALVWGSSSASNPSWTTLLPRCVEFFHKSSGWFDCPEPSSIHLERGCKISRVLGGSSSASNVIKPSQTCYCRHSKVLNMSSGWFDLTEHSLGTPLKGKQSGQRTFALVRGSSSALNLLEPPLTTLLLMWQGV